MIEQITGESQISDYKAPASTAFAFNDVVTRDSNGQLAKATALTPRSEFLGLIQQTIASTDDDYASVKTVAVSKFTEDEAEFLVDVSSGTLTSAMVGLRYDLASASGIDVTSQGQKCVEITRFISTTQARARFVIGGDKMRLVSYQQAISVSEFTDGGGVLGTFALGISIPAGATFAHALVTGVVGFAGDTTATIEIGDGSDTNRYSTATPSVFSTASAGVAIGAPTGVTFHSTAKTPTVGITGATDFTAIATNGNGAMVVTLFWYEAN